MGTGKKIVAHQPHSQLTEGKRAPIRSPDPMEIDTPPAQSPINTPNPDANGSHPNSEQPTPHPSPSPGPPAQLSISKLKPPVLQCGSFIIKQPLELGTKAPCYWRNQGYQECEIIDRRMKPGTDVYEYYVHYSEFNRRLDEWVDFKRFDLEALTKVETRRLARKAASERANNASRAKSERKRRDSKKKKSKAKANEVEKMPQAPPLEKATKEKGHDEAAKVKNIQTIVLGCFAIDTWYYSPFPGDYSNYSVLYFCEFCLKFVRSQEALHRHCKRCVLRHPPGIEIYRKDNISMFEVDGATNRLYCQNLCYIAKLFLDHKTLYYDVDPFWFYVMCEVDDQGAHIVGYFSKEKYSEEDYNVACILTLPPFQRKGYGKFLMAFSYELSKLENLVGSPEKPLSDLGLLGYRSYWSHVLVDLLRKEKSSALSIYEISEKTMMKTEDIIGTLQALDLIQYYEGQHILDMRRVANLKMGSNGLPCDPSCIKWTPHTQGPGVQIPPGATLAGPSFSARRR